MVAPASFPGLPHFIFLFVFSIIHGKWGRPGNEASGCLLVETEYSDPGRLGMRLSSNLFFLSWQLGLNTRARPKSATTAVMSCREEENQNIAWLELVRKSLGTKLGTSSLALK